MVSAVSYANSSSISLLTAKSPVSQTQAYVAGSTAKDSTAASTSSAASTSQAGSGVSTYDFTNMTPNQMKNVAAKLFNSGQLNFNQLFELQNVGMPLGKVGSDGQFIPLTDAERTQFANTPVNYIEKLQGAVDFLKQRGGAADSKSGYDNWTGLLTTLQSLQGKPSGVNITA